MSVFTLPKTHIGRVRQDQSLQLMEVCQLLKWTPDQYCQHQYDQYELFIARMWDAYPDIHNLTRYSPIFRSFWNNDWSHRNEVDFLPFAYDCKYDESYMEEEYIFIHGYMRLINDDEFLIRYENALKLI